VAKNASPKVMHIKRGQKVDGKVYKNCTERSNENHLVIQQHKYSMIRYYRFVINNYVYTMYGLKVY